MTSSVHVASGFIKACIILSILGLTQKAAFAQDHQFVHPGIRWTTSDLDRLAQKRLVSPWSEGYREMIGTSQGSLNYQMQGPFTLVENKGANQREHTSDAQAAIYHALQWYFTRDERHAVIATEILDAWATTHTDWGGPSVHLHAAWRGGMMVRAAEILRYTYPGWTDANTEHCETYFLDILYPLFRRPNPLRAANQGANNLWGAVSVAIFCNDEDKFQDCLNAYLNDPCGGISNTLPNGQCGDSGRDQGHAAAMIGNLAAAAQIFYTQGVDVYPVLDNRLLHVMEYWCKYNSGQEVEFIDHGTSYGYYTEIGSRNRRDDYGDFASAYENVRAAYVVRGGLEAPHTLAYIDRIEPQIDTFMDRKDASFDSSALRSREPYTPFMHQDVTSLSSTDIGSPRREGNNDLSDGTWTINGSGNGFNEGASTSYHFAYTQLSGDGEIIAKVDSLENSDTDAGAALVLRTSLTDALGDNATILARPTEGTQFSSRGTDAADGDGSQTFPLSNLPDGDVWLRLERRGNRVAGYVGPDGVTWAPMQHVIFDDLPDTVFIGLASTSATNNFRATAEFSNVQTSKQPEIMVTASGSDVAPTVSSDDLAQTAFLSSSATSDSELATEHGQLFNGLIGNSDGDSSDLGEVRMFANDTLTINFDTVRQPQGYDITEINSFFGWNIAAGGRSNQGYSIRFNLVDGSSQLIAGEHWNPNDPAFFWTTVSFTELSSGVIATGVESITFTITNSAIPGRHVVGREFDIFGSPTGGSNLLLGDCNQDGVVNFLDISPFISILSTGDYLGQADMNQDERVDFLDISQFISRLSQ